MSRDQRRRRVPLFLVGCVFLGACSLLTPQPDPTRFYVLEPLPLGEVAELRAEMPSGLGALAIGIGPIRFPDYLRRTQIVTRSTPNRIEVSEIDRWAEPPDTDFARILGSNVGALLGTERIALFPWYVLLRLDYQITAEVLRFESTGGRQAELHVRWAIKGGQGEKVLRVFESNLSETLDGAGAEAAVRALSRALGGFSIEVVSAIRRLEEAR